MANLLTQLLTRLATLQANPRWRATSPAVLLACVVLLCLWKFPAYQVTHTPGTTEQNRFEREDEARKTLAQIIGGVVILGGLYMSFKTFGLSREGQITDRFTKAIEQLGKTDGTHPNIEVRLGAIYALERLARDSPPDHWTIMEVLTAYVRQNAPAAQRAPQNRGEVLAAFLPQDGPPVPDKPYSAGEKPRTDIQAILAVIARRKTGPSRERAGQRLYLADTRLCNITLLNLNLQHAVLRNIDLQGAFLHGANLQQANLLRANLRGTNLVGANLQDADCGYINLQSAELPNANLQEAYMKHANLLQANLSGANLRAAKLGSANLQGATLIDANLQDAYLGRADLRHALLFNANLQNVEFALADLRGTNLQNADLRAASLRDANLQGASLDRADLQNVTNMTPEQIKSARDWETARYSPVFRAQLGLAPEVPVPSKM